MALEYYQLVTNYGVDVQPIKPYFEPAKETSPIFLMGDAKEITLAEFDSASRGLITAHHLKDYRRRNFTLIMLPDARLVLDEVLEEVGELGEFL